MRIYCRNTLSGLVPLYPNDMDEKRKLKVGRDYEVEIKHPRNYEFHKKFFALINLAHNNTHLDMPFDAYRRYLIAKAGYFDVYTTDKGQFIEPKSISFTSMNQVEFEEVYSRVLNVIIKELGLTEEEVTENLINFF